MKIGTEILLEKSGNHILTRLSCQRNFRCILSPRELKTCLAVNMFNHDFCRRKWLASISFMSMKNALEGI